MNKERVALALLIIASLQLMSCNESYSQELAIDTPQQNQLINDDEMSSYLLELMELEYLSRDKVKQLQNSLNILGYSPGPSDGLFGEKTINALKEWSLNTESDIDLEPLFKIGGKKSCRQVFNSWRSTDPEKNRNHYAKLRVDPESLGIDLSAPVYILPDGCAIEMRGQRARPYCGGKPMSYDSCRP